MQRIASVFLVIVAWVSLTGPSVTPAVAQLVQIAPGYVRAPFVRVYSNPDGSSYVRAPFVSVYSPPRFYAIPGNVYVEPATRVRRFDSGAGIREDFSQLDGRALRQRVREGADRLERNLARRETGAEWRDFLSIDALKEAIAADVDEPPADDEGRQLRAILSKYQATLNSPDLANITGIDGFRTVHGALSELLASPLDKTRRQLAAASRELEADLSRIRAGESWRRFLRLPQDVIDPASPNSPPDTSPSSIEELQQALANFEQTSEDSQYRVIAQLPGFQSTHARLSEYISLATGASPELGEELPPPIPEGPDESRADAIDDGRD